MAGVCKGECLGRGGHPVNDVWHSAVVKSGYVSSRTLWIKFKFSRVMAPLKEKVKKEIGFGTTCTRL